MSVTFDQLIKIAGRCYPFAPGNGKRVPYTRFKLVVAQCLVDPRTKSVALKKGEEVLVEDFSANSNGGQVCVRHDKHLFVAGFSAFNLRSGPPG